MNPEQVQKMLTEDELVSRAAKRARQKLLAKIFILIAVVGVLLLLWVTGR